MKAAVNINRASKYVYSDKINNRRRSLFPCEHSERVDKFSNHSDLDQMNPLGTSDSECENNDGVSSDISLIVSTNLVGDILSTPKSKNYPPSEQSMSPLYLSPYGKMQLGKSILSAVSPSKHLKTPNDSNIHCNMLPKLSRKCSQEHTLLKFDMQKSLPPTLSKCSKVRTTLFPDLDAISFAPKQFYPKLDFNEPFSEKKILSKQSDVKMYHTKKKSENKNKKKLLGQINTGVRHKIKKPKKRKILEPKVSSTLLSKIKTFKKNEVVDSKLDGFLKDLAELNESKKIKLIHHSPIRHTSKCLEDKSNLILKRSYDCSENIASKKQKLSSNKYLSSPLSKLSDDPTSEFANEDCELATTENINDILSLLEDRIGQNKENKSNDKGDSNNVDHCFTETLLSPTSEMCNMASVMKLDSPKKVRNLNLLFQNMNDKNLDIENAEENGQYQENTNHIQYFPIFYSNSKVAYKSEADILKGEPATKRKKAKISSNQMLLDAGQKHFGLIECSHCNYVYQAGDPSDETMHENHHNATHILQFSGWKNEHIVHNLPNGGRIIQVLPTDSKLWIEKVKKVIEVINRDMGYYDMTLDISTSKVFLFITNRAIIGCLVAESKTRGSKILSSDAEIDLCSTEEYAIECGVSRIWVAPRYRKKGIATKLMDILKSHFLPGRLLRNCDIALSSPTTDGKLFAAKYFQTKHFFTYFD